MTWDWAYAASIMPELMFGVLVTVLVTIACSAIALVGGLLIAIAQMNSGRTGHYAMRVIMEIFRGVPILVLLYFGFLRPARDRHPPPWLPRRRPAAGPG